MRRRPSEKIPVRLFPGQVDYLLSLLEKQTDVNARLIADRLKAAALQRDLKEIDWDQTNR